MALALETPTAATSNVTDEMMIGIRSRFNVNGGPAFFRNEK
jgi:hypothetical protein